MIELETVTVYRGDTDRKGNVSKDAHGQVGVVFAWGTPSRSSDERVESAEFSAQVFAPKGTDLRARDRIQRSNGERYSVVGHPQWDEPSELEVFDYAWVVFQVESMNG